MATNDSTEFGRDADPYYVDEKFLEGPGGYDY